MFNILNLKEFPIYNTIESWVKSHPILAVSASISSYWIIKQLIKPKNLPPGPISIPYLGGGWKFLFDNPETMFYKFPEKYGNISSIYIGDQLHIFVASYELIKELLITRKDDFNDRQPNDPIMQFFDIKDLIFSASNDSIFKKNKSKILSILKNVGFGKNSLENKINDSCNKMIENYLETEGTAIKVVENLRIACGMTIMSVIMSKNYAKDDKELKCLINDISEWMTNSGIISFLYSLIPFPYYSLRLIGRKHRKIKEEMYKYVRKNVEEHVNNEKADFITGFLKEFESKVDHDAIVATIFVTFPDAIHTLAFVLEISIKYLANHPKIQEKAYNILISVLSSRDLTMADRSNLAYIEAIVLESLRHSDTIPMLTGRCARKTTTFHGYTIPREAVIFALVKSVHKDEEIYKDPSKFQPERFIDEDGKLIKSDAFMSFGIGQRMCIGESLTRMESFFFLSKILMTFKITTESGEIVENYIPEGSIFVDDKLKVVFKKRS